MKESFEEGPEERDVRDVDGCRGFADIPVQKERAVGLAEVVISVEDGTEDLPISC